MLLGFKVKNYRSFKDLQHFSLLAGKVRANENHIVEIGKRKVLKFSGMFGANGSGKSNFILALSIVQTIVNRGIDSLINNLYYRGSRALRNEDSYFEYELALNNKLYSYGFEINIFKRTIVSEWLIDMTKSNEKVIFERDLKKKLSKTDLKKTNSIFSNCLHEMENNDYELFLKEIIRRVSISQSKDIFFDEIVSVYKFLIYDMIVVKPQTHKLFDIDYYKRKEEVLKILKSLDINIVDIDYEETDIKNIQSKLSDRVFADLKNDMDLMISRFNKISCTLRIENDLYTIKKIANGNYDVKALKFKHKNSDSLFGTYEESDGTIRILELIDILLSKDKLFLIDELDSSLHPLLVTGLLKIFLQSNINNQLIITTHEMKTLDFDLVRRDEIWFAEKSENGETRIYSLEEFKDVARFDRKIDKAYMEGRFGAIANIDSSYEN